MANATKQVQIIEIGDHTFLITCPFPENIDELTAFPFFDVNDQWDQFIDRGEEGFEVRINPQHWDGSHRGIPGILDVLKVVWDKLYDQHLVTTRALPDINFGENGSQSTFTCG